VKLRRINGKGNSKKKDVVRVFKERTCSKVGLAQDIKNWYSSYPL